ncbi:glucosamine-6-phosphate deaminase [Devosia sp. YIM 151766]|uniref:glucosamine-6-phosphate deaminase n=1 Tax=Devosia sp. YIM 151766 TaxID=3017325 RepID=UPI00255CAC8C|nr:glucosamine-6-phosphate deaminase [Devosia sp. YIM 151766]WIY52082.1 glucosamine-6-phosphate deaminase [Devosia sp. YIM 151766]
MHELPIDIRLHESRAAMDVSAARAIGDAVRDVLAGQDSANVVFAAAPSQAGTLTELLKLDDVDWSRVNAFHMDEYVGLPADHPAGFGNWLRRHFFDAKAFRSINLISPEGNADDVAAAYAKDLSARPIDLVCFGIGVNGHIAFNDPPVADFNDPMLVKRVTLDLVCRQQQVDDGCFATLEDVPAEALTLTIPALLKARRMIGVVPTAAKRDAVERALSGPITTECPASILRTHPNCSLFLEPESQPR